MSMFDVGGNGNPDGKPKANVTPRCGAMGAKGMYIFAPREDVTPFELAECLVLANYGIGVMVGAIPPEACDQVYRAMGASSQRHWVAHKKPTIQVAKQMPPEERR